MGKAKEPLPVKLISGLIYQKEEISETVKERLIGRFGKIDCESGVFPFDFTDYYEKEIGKGLKRQFISFEPLIRPEDLPGIKIDTNRLEDELAEDRHGKRGMNIDPGYLAKEKLILATTKNYDHRPYLGSGIYAELTYRFSGGSFQVLEWTYPDYRLKDSIDIFNEMRKIYLKQLNKAYEKTGIGKLT